MSAEGDYIPKFEANKPCTIISPVYQEEDMGNLAQHLRAKVIEKAMNDGLEDKAIVALALQAAAGSDKQINDRRKLEVANRAVDNEAEARAFISSVLDRVGGNPFAKDATVDVDRLLNEDEGQLPDIVLNKGALEVGISDLNYERFLSENDIDTNTLSGPSDEE